MKKLKLVIIILFVNTSIHAQWTNVLNDNKIYKACFAINEQICFVGGDNGLIYKTLDGGSSWQSTQTKFKNSSISDIYFPSPSIGYACGGNFTFAPDKNIILKTINGGSTWDSISANTSPGFYLNKIYFINDNIGFFCGFDQIFKTIDGGRTFQQITLNAGPNADIMDIKFITQNLGFVAIGNSIYKTINQGNNWTTNFNNTSNLSSISFLNEKNGFAVGENGIILKTNNGGDTWTTKNIGKIQLNCVQFVSDSIAYCGGFYVDKGEKYKYLAKTIDGGNTWLPQFTSKEIGEINSLSFLTPNIGYIGGIHQVFKTTNGGTTAVSEVVSPDLIFNITPNPSLGDIKINSILPFNRLEVYDIKGQLIINHTYYSTLNTNLHIDNKGLYFIKLSYTDSRSHFLKICIE